MNIDLRTCLRALVLSHLDRGSEEALSVFLTVRSEITPVTEHMKVIDTDENHLDDEFLGECFGFATINLIISRPSNYTKVYRTFSVRGHKDLFDAPMLLVGNHDSCWVDGAIRSVKDAAKKATEFALAEVKEIVLPEYAQFYEQVRPSTHINIDNVERCFIISVEGEDEINKYPISLNIGPSNNKTRFI